MRLCTTPQIRMRTNLRKYLMIKDLQLRFGALRGILRGDMQPTVLPARRSRHGAQRDHALVEELHRQAGELAEVPRRLLRVFSRNGQMAFEAELRRHAKEIGAMGARLSRLAPARRRMA